MARLACFLALVTACGEVTRGADGGIDGENQAPTDVELSANSVEEQAPPGSRVGLLTAVDPDGGDRHTFELVDDGGGLFAIDGDRLEVAPGAIPNYETGASVTIRVAATDEGGLAIEEDLAIEIVDLREVVNTTDDGAGSLRQTISDALPGETILFETGLDPMIAVNSPLLLTKNVTIRGPLAPAEIVLDALGNNRVFDVSPAATVTLQQLTIRGGSSPTGGGILNEGVLTVERCLFEDNLAEGSGFGGAIQNRNALVARDSLFRRNRGFNKGAIAAGGAGGTLIERCTFEENETTGNSSGAVGGGAMTILNSTFVGNSTTGTDRPGGAVAVFDSDSVIAFSTFADNSATGDGGGIYCSGSSGPIRLTLRGSLVTRNLAASGDDIAIDADCTIQGDHNGVSNGTGSGLTDGEDGNLVGFALAVGELGDNGGPTPTAAPDSDSPTVDMVPAEVCTAPDGAPLAEDQRGAARPSGAACDAGAVEL